MTVPASDGAPGEAGISHTMSGVRPSRRSTSTVIPGRGRERAQPASRSTAASMCPFAAQSGSNIGLLHGMRM